LDFVPLEMADHVPADFGGQAGSFGLVFQELIHFIGDLLEVLDAIFTEVDMPQADDFLDGGDGGGFGLQRSSVHARDSRPRRRQAAAIFSRTVWIFSAIVLIVRICTAQPKCVNGFIFFQPAAELR